MIGLLYGEKTMTIC